MMYYFFKKNKSIFFGDRIEFFILELLAGLYILHFDPPPISKRYAAVGAFKIQKDAILPRFFATSSFFLFIPCTLIFNPTTPPPQKKTIAFFCIEDKIPMVGKIKWGRDTNCYAFIFFHHLTFSYRIDISGLNNVLFLTTYFVNQN